MNNEAILVTGATGNVGREVVRMLRARGVTVRAGTRRGPLEGRPEDVRLDFQDSKTFAAAAEGCGAMFLLRPPAISDVRATLIPLIGIARSVGVQQVVFLSVAGADKNPLVPHHAVEKHLKSHPGGFTLLRPGFFAQNLATAYLRDLREDHRLVAPSGEGRIAFVDVRDVAAVAVQALLEPEAHKGAGYTLTGAEALTLREVAELLTTTLGWPIRYDAVSAVAYAAHLRAQGLPWAQVAVQTILHLGLRFGQASAVDPTLERLLGHPSIRMLQFIRENVGLWKQPAAGRRAEPRTLDEVRDLAALASGPSGRG